MLKKWFVDLGVASSASNPIPACFRASCQRSSPSATLTANGMMVCGVSISGVSPKMKPKSIRKRAPSSRSMMLSSWPSRIPNLCVWLSADYTRCQILEAFSDPAEADLDQALLQAVPFRGVQVVEKAHLLHDNNS